MKVTGVTMEKEKRNVLVKKFMNMTEVNTDINIPINVIQDLRLAMPMPRQQRRKIARKANMDWDLYRLLEREVIKRLKAKVDLSTGKPIEKEEENNG
jgi:hypothetical protein